MAGVDMLDLNSGSILNKNNSNHEILHDLRMCAYVLWRRLVVSDVSTFTSKLCRYIFHNGKGIQLFIWQDRSLFSQY